MTRPTDDSDFWLSVLDIMWSRYKLSSEQIFEQIPYAELIDRLRAARVAMVEEQRASMRPAAFVSFYVGLSQGAKSKEFSSFQQFLRANGLTDEIPRPPEEVDRLRDKINQMSEDLIDEAMQGAFFKRP